MKRISPFMLLLISAAVLASCGDSGTVPAVNETTPVGQAKETEAVTEAAEVTDGLPDIDMDGFTLGIYHNDSNNMTWTNLLLDVAEQTGEVLEDAVYTRNRKIEERFNCHLKVDVFSTAQSIGVNEIKKEVLGGLSTYDLWFPRDKNVTDSIPYLRPMNDLPYVNLDAEWWFPEASKVFRFGDKQYAATSSFSLSQISRAAGFVFNKDVYREIGADQMPYEYVRQNKWTLETLFDLSKLAVKDLNGDNKMDENDRFGIGSSWKEIYARFLNGSGVFFIEQDKDGYPVFSLPENEGAINKMMHIFELFSDDEVYHNPSTNPENVPAQGIIEGTCLFVLGHPNNMGTKYRQSDVDVGYLPCPKYDEQQERYYSTTWAGEMMVILKTLPDERLENVSMILEALSFESDRTVMDIYKEVMMKSKFARDPESEEMFDIVLDSMVFDMGLIAWEDSVANKLIGDIFASGKGNVVSTFEKQSKSINKTLDKLISSLSENE